MSMSVTPVELVLYVEFVAAVHDHHRRDPSEREEKTLHSLVQMMLADSTRAIQGEQRRTGNLADEGQRNHGGALLCQWQQVQRRSHGVGCQSRSRGRGSAVA